VIRYSIVACLLHRNAFILRTAVWKEDPLAALRGLFPVGLILRDIETRHRTVSQDVDLNCYFEWRMQHLQQMYGDEIDNKDVKYESEQQFRQMTQWKYLLRKA
jgi:hypothetical protein